MGTSRTRVLGDLIFLSSRYKARWGSDYVFCARHDGTKFDFIATVCDDDCRAVMPAAASITGRIVVTIRRKGHRHKGGWIDAFASDDGGKSWRFTSTVGKTGKWNGNPPALIARGDELFCTYGNRTLGAMMIAASGDGGETWKERAFREGGETDIGYPQLFLRSDGRLVCVYYWAAGKKQGIEASFIDA